MKVTIDLGIIKEECFVLMPFSPKTDLIYEEVLKPAIEDANLTPVRADEIYGTRRIMQDIWDSIRSARLVVARRLFKRSPLCAEDKTKRHRLTNETGRSRV